MSLTQESFTVAMEEFFSDLGGSVGVYVEHLDCDLSLAYNADELYPTASTLKTPLLYELFRQSEAGMIDLTARVTLSHSNRVPGSGILQDLDDGLQPTFRDLAELMIIVSDNWATDLLYAMIGKDNMAATLGNLGLHNTFIPLTIREMFIALGDLDPADESIDYDILKDRLKNYRASDDNVAFAADARNDVSSPRDMGTLMRLIHEGHGLSEDGRTGVLKILKDQNFNTRIPARLPVDAEIEVAHKTGTIRGVANDVGIVYSPKGNYIITMMSKFQADGAETTDRLARASRWIWDELTADES
ncbi:MAG: class A beta-lactamase-related serine hydrolase [Thermomicrobiales bacterium]|nr:class A beta-lactamase-related serine hydrolase [Thermomicrobiales bacterium]